MQQAVNVKTIVLSSRKNHIFRFILDKFNPSWCKLQIVEILYINTTEDWRMGVRTKRKKEGEKVLYEDMFNLNSSKGIVFEKTCEALKYYYNKYE